MSEFQDKDFSRMMFQFRNNPTLDYREQYPEFKHFPEFSAPIHESVDRNTLIRYIGFCYDKESPFRITYKNLNDRKVRAAIQAGFEFSEDKFDKHVEDVIECKNPNTNLMIIGYCKLHNSMTYRHLVLVETLYYNKEREVFLNQTSIKMTELRQIREEFDKTMAEFLAEENTAGLVKSLYSSINRERISLAPEDVAKGIKDKGYENAIA